MNARTLAFALVTSSLVACGSSGNATPGDGGADGATPSKVDAARTDAKHKNMGHADAGRADATRMDAAHVDSATGDAANAGDAGDAEAGGAPLSIFVVPAQLTDLAATTFYDHPWPSDYRLDQGGNIVFTGLPNPGEEGLLSLYLTATVGLVHGFSTAAFGYFRFATDLDPTTLPATPPDTLAATSTVQIINVDPSSPEHDQRHLAQIYYRQAAGVYWQPDTLAIGPALGYPLLPSTKYAIVVTRGLASASGTAIGPSADLSAVLGLTPTNATNKPVHDLFAAALADVVALGIPATNIAHFTYFTTNDPAALLFSIADNVPNQIPPPKVLDDDVPSGGLPDASSLVYDAGPSAKSSLVYDPADGEPGVYDVYRGWYGPAPNYQQGVAPYMTSGGGFVTNGDAGAVLQNTFPMLFTLVVPSGASCTMPASGWPILMYGHGTGGSNRSVIDEGGSVGDAMARQCIASIGTDQIFQGVRPGAPAADDPNAELDEELAFFNVGNPAAFRANTIQSAIDVVQEARLFTETKMTVPASTSVTGTPINFDADKLLFMGHSQGSLNGPLYFATDSSSRGGVLSGASSDVSITLLDKTSPTPSVAGLWLLALGLNNPTDAPELNIFHPIMSFAQTEMDLIDPLVYMRYLVQSPRPGHAPKSIYQTEGVTPDGGGDTFAPPHGIEIGSIAIGLPVQAPFIHTIAEESWGGLQPVTVTTDAGISGNLADGGASGILAQFLPPPDDDGHFVFFDVPECRLQAAQFAARLAANPKGSVPPLSP